MSDATLANYPVSDAIFLANRAQESYQVTHALLGPHPQIGLPTVAPTLCPTIIKGDGTTVELDNRLEEARAILHSGDRLLLTFTGHGNRIGQHSSWVLGNGDLLDVNLYQALAAFRNGVNILVLSDACYSGSIILPPGRAGPRQEDCGPNVILIAAAYRDEPALTRRGEGGTFTEAALTAAASPGLTPPQLFAKIEDLMKGLPHEPTYVPVTSNPESLRAFEGEPCFF